MKNIKIVIAYDGGSYLGWQKTAMGPSIENTVQLVLEKILQHLVTLQAASRTDAGVHADHQVVNFFTTKDLHLERFKLSMNALLPKDIVVLDIEQMPFHFHPTVDCKNKTYHYCICSGPIQMPQHRHYSWHYHYSLDLENMRRACSFLIGTHDFTSFCNVNPDQIYSHYMRTIDLLEIAEIHPQRLQIKVKGSNFLYKMVRNIVGTLAYVGTGKIDDSQLPKILNSKDRKAAGLTAPAHGLFLHQINY